MHWSVLLTENYTQCKFEGARRFRARANAFCSTSLAIKPCRSAPLAVLRNSNKIAIIIGIMLDFQLSCMEHNPGRKDGKKDNNFCL
jgi:hypothetical protein